MRRLALALVCLVGLCVFPGCGPANSASVDPRALARGTVETMETVWIDMANVCVANGPEGGCGQALDSARNVLIAAADAVNTWDAAAQKSFPCLLKQLMADVQDGAAMLSKAIPANVASELNDAMSLAQAFIPQCVAP